MLGIYQIAPVLASYMLAGCGRILDPYLEAHVEQLVALNTSVSMHKPDPTFIDLSRRQSNLRKRLSQVQRWERETTQCVNLFSPAPNLASQTKVGTRDDTVRQSFLCST